MSRNATIDKILEYGGYVINDRRQAPNIYELFPRYDSRKSFCGKAHIKETPASLVLVSYETEILRLDKKTKALRFLCRDEWAFTQTTNRHINEFLKQFTDERPKSKSELLRLANAK